MNFCLIFIVFVAWTCEFISESKTVLNVKRSLAFQVLQSTLKTKKNTIVSTLPVQFSLCKLALVAKGKAKDELLKAVGMADDTMIHSFFSYFREPLERQARLDMIYANKIYVNYSDNIAPSFMNSSSNHGVSVEKVSFNFPKTASVFINKKISTATYRRIEDIVQPSDFDSNSRMLLVTAAQFKPTWESPFKTTLTRAVSFRHLDNKISNIPMMSRNENLNYFDAKDFEIVGTKLLGMCMIFVKPTFVSLERLLQKFQLDPDLLDNAIEQMKPIRMKLVIPRMNIKSQHDLTGFVRDIGLSEVLNSSSTGLNDILKQGVNASNIFINKIKQKLALEVDEYGIYRLRYARWDDDESWPPALGSVVFDRPFYFSINMAITIEADIRKGQDAAPPRYELYDFINGVFYGPE